MSGRFAAALVLAVGMAGTTTFPARADGSNIVLAQAQQGFRVCNHSGYEVMVAKAVNLTPGGSPADILSEGWWRVGSRSCLVLYPGPLQYRYYLVYAHVVDSTLEWGGNLPVCVSADAFRIRNPLCGEGFNRRMFRQIDTNASPRSGHTYDLTD